ncbi:hypothetical protein SAMN05421747_11552 [Parapedobacter composti]|uniref:Uncharacterized protein n=1 Tax=Parapedobacter composti TaxID=623281 RepID=A0A1I1KGZ8_9SPHI|nr:hypothetical protein SAMN05421747_11552 [Parapedobacter composti]
MTKEALDAPSLYMEMFGSLAEANAVQHQYPLSCGTEHSCPVELADTYPGLMLTCETRHPWLKQSTTFILAYMFVYLNVMCNPKKERGCYKQPPSM